VLIEAGGIEVEAVGRDAEMPPGIGGEDVEDVGPGRALDLLADGTETVLGDAAVHAVAVRVRVHANLRAGPLDYLAAPHPSAHQQAHGRPLHLLERHAGLLPHRLNVQAVASEARLLEDGCLRQRNHVGHANGHSRHALGGQALRQHLCLVGGQVLADDARAPAQGPGGLEPRHRLDHREHRRGHRHVQFSSRPEHDGVRVAAHGSPPARGTALAGNHSITERTETASSRRGNRRCRPAGIVPREP